MRGLRLGEFDVLVVVYLLREGLDLPEFTLAILLHERRNSALGNKRDRSQKDEDWTEVSAKDVTRLRC